VFRTILVYLALVFPASLFAATPPSFPVSTANATVDGPYQINYASNLNMGDGVINVTNTGSSAGSTTPITGFNSVGDICVNAYVYAPDQELAACCTCVVSPNSLHSWPIIFGADALLTNINNTTAGASIASTHSVVIKLLATAPTGNSSNATATCAGPTLGATSSNGTTINTAAVAFGMVAWGTHSHPTNNSSTVAITETPFANSALSQGEVGKLTGDCFVALHEGSGQQCPGCLTGGLALGTSLQ
jgi:hypothetical protein